MANKHNNSLKQTAISWGFTLPYMSVFFIFTVLPVLASIVLSFTNFNMLQAPTFNSINNYIRLFLEDDIFKTALKNTLFFALLTGPLSYVLCFVFAWLINSLNRRLRTVLTLFYYAPSIAGNMATIWALIFSGDEYGLMNGMLMKLGIVQTPVQWLTDTTYITEVVIIVILWSSL